MRRLTQELVGLLRDQDFCTLSPDGMLVVRLNAAGVPEVDAAINRILPAITHKRVIDGAKVEIALATSVYPRDGTNADELTQFLRRPERKRVVQVAETEHTQRVDRGRLDR
jgi:lactam utilization protein B